ncbi:MAG TPA: hypothetical protein VG839_06005 [Asticcacaulis sp.]|nr:hypothetical protein [Asticcacaulis sp.]
MATPDPARIGLNNRSRNMLLSVGMCIALLAVYYMLVGKEPVPPDTHVSYEVRTAGRTTLRVDMLGSGVTSVAGPNGQMAGYATPDFAVRRVLAAFRKQRFLDLDVAAFPPVSSSEVCQLGLTENHRRVLLRYDCAAPPPEVKSVLQVFEGAAHFCQRARRNGLACEA